MKTEIQPQIEQDNYWQQDPGPLPAAEIDQFTVAEVRVGGRSFVREVVETVVLTLLIFLGARLVIQNFMVEGNSMDPTLHSGQYLLVNRADYFMWDSNFFARLNPLEDDEQYPPQSAYIFGGPARGDIIVFHSPNNSRESGVLSTDRDFIKRVIALPGEKVQVKANEGVFIDDIKLNEPYIKDIPDYNWPAGDESGLIAEGAVFVLGDNRSNSDDSHIFGPIPLSSVIGTAWFSYGPLEYFGPLPSTEY